MPVETVEARHGSLIGSQHEAMHLLYDQSRVLARSDPGSQLSLGESLPHSSCPTPRGADNHNMRDPQES